MEHILMFGVRVDIIDDSGPAILSKGATKSGALDVWGFVKPTGCSPCETYADVLTAARKSQPMSKYGFISYAEDTVISKDTGYTVAEFPAVIDAFVNTLESDPNAATFIVTNKQSHVVQSNLALAAQYLPWFTQLATDDPAWTSKTYAVP